MAKRRMSAKQRKYFGRARRSVRRVARRVGRGIRKAYSTGYKRRSRSPGGGLKGLLPVSIKEGAIDFGAGLALPTMTRWVAPYSDKILSPLGSYKDEARTALMGMVLYKFGGLVSPLVKEGGRSLFKFATVSAGIQTSSKLIVTNGGTQSGIPLM